MRTTNYEISKQLVEAKFKENQVWNQEGKFWGYDLETILEVLPDFIKLPVPTDKNYYLEAKLQFFYGYQDTETKILGFCYRSFGGWHWATEKEQNESLADAAAKLWLKLKQEKLV